MRKLVRKSLTIILWSFATLILIAGAMMLYSGMQEYLGGEMTDVSPFSTTLLGTAIVSLVLSAVFTHRAMISYRTQGSRYGQPDSPSYFFLLVALSGLLALLTFVSFIAYLTFTLQS